MDVVQLYLSIHIWKSTRSGWNDWISLKIAGERIFNFMPTDFIRLSHTYARNSHHSIENRLEVHTAITTWSWTGSAVNGCIISIFGNAPMLKNIFRLVVPDSWPLLQILYSTLSHSALHIGVWVKRVRLYFKATKLLILAPRVEPSPAICEQTNKSPDNGCGRSSEYSLWT